MSEIMSQMNQGMMTGNIEPGMMTGNNIAPAIPARKMTRERVQKAADTLKKYAADKQRYKSRLLEDEKWWQAHAWDVMLEQGNPNMPKRPTKWLVNVILGKHADLMDAYPEPVILPREQNDEAEARKLTSILPVILEQNDFEQVYSNQAWEKNKHGTGAYAVYWDSEKLNGLGDICVCGVDMMNLFWEPGIEDIQKSRNVFLVAAEDKETLKQRYPQLEDKNLQSELTVQPYQTEGKPTQQDKALVVDWYYHTWDGGRKTLHYCKFVGLEVLYASEDDEKLQGRGWYDDGEYPFVLDVLFPQKQSPVGWGYLDLGKDTQEEIDLISYALTINTLAGAIPRYFRHRDSAINLEQFLDFTQPVIEVEGSLSDADMRPVEHYKLDGNYMSYWQNKIEELKSVTGNMDVQNGGTGGVTAASGIAALQEAAGRTSRDGNRGTYRAYSQILEKVIERIRQFYDVPRTFRILGDGAQYQYETMDNSGITLQPNPTLPGLEDMPMGWRKPVFDIQVAAQKQNSYSKMAQNELAIQLMGCGVFNPEMADQSLLLLGMMDFKDKDTLVQKLQGFQTMKKLLAQYQMLALELAKKYEPETAAAIAQSVVGQAGQPQGTPVRMSVQEQPKGTAGTADAANVVKAREQARAVSQPDA